MSIPLLTAGRDRPLPQNSRRLLPKALADTDLHTSLSYLQHPLPRCAYLTNTPILRYPGPRVLVLNCRASCLKIPARMPGPYPLPRPWTACLPVWHKSPQRSVTLDESHYWFMSRQHGLIVHQAAMFYIIFDLPDLDRRLEFMRYSASCLRHDSMRDLTAG